MRVSGIFTIACGAAMLLSLAQPAVANVKGVQLSEEWDRRNLKGDSEDDDDEDDDDEDDDGIGIPDVDDIVDAVGCFSEVSTVQVEGVMKPVAMRDLKVGDQVLASTGSYEQVYAFGHWNPTKEATFYQLYTSPSETPLEMTGEHMVYLSGKRNPVRTDSIQAGDVLQSIVLGSKSVGTAEISKIRKVTREGVYTPLTPSGKIVVDGIQASSYISLQDNAPEFVQVQGVNLPMSQQEFVHVVLSPFRMMCLGISSSLCQVNRNMDQGIPPYVAYGMRFIQWGERTQPLLVQILILSVAAVLYGASMFLENCLGASLAPMAVLVCGVIYAWMKIKGVSIRTHKSKTA